MKKAQVFPPSLFSFSHFSLLFFSFTIKYS